MMQALTAEMAVQLVPLIVAGFVAYLARAAKAWLVAHSQSTMLASVVDALGRAGQLAAQEYVAGKATMSGAAHSMVAYVNANLPETVAKLEPNERALHDMASAVLLEVLTARGVIGRNAAAGA
jgi:hypothetical protein